MTLPPELVRLILAMTPQRVCRECGEPSRRVVEVEYDAHGDAARQNAEPQAGSRRLDADKLSQREENAQGMAHGRATKVVSTLGWTSCDHNNDRPGTVLDPFAQSGIVGVVAEELGRDSILIEDNEGKSK